MRAYRLLILVLAFLAVVLVPWWLTYDPDEPRPGEMGEPETTKERVRDPRLRPAGSAPEAPAETALSGTVLEGRVFGDPPPAAAEIHLYRLGAQSVGWPFSQSLDGVGAVFRQATMPGDGAFVLGGVPAGRYVIRAQAADGRRGWEDVTVEEGGGRTFVRVSLLGGDLRLRGRVVHIDGSPWRGRVFVGREAAGTTWWAEGDLGATDAEGRFEMDGLQAGMVRVTAVSRGTLERQSPPLRLPHEGEYVLVVDEGVDDLPGVALRSTDETPVEGASVLCVSYGKGGILHARARTDAEGRFSVSSLAGRSYVVVEKPGYVKSYGGRGVDGAEARMLLVPLQALVGRVVEADGGGPVSGARVVATGGGSPRAMLTDVDGHFAFDDVAPGDWLVSVFGGGWHCTGIAEHRGFAGNVEVPSEGTAEILLEVVRAPTARGRVLDPDGVPVADARVRPVALRRHYDSSVDRYEAPVYVTDADGNFIVDTLVTGLEHRLRAEASGFAPAWSDSFRPEAGSETQIDLTLPPRRMLEARVLAAKDDAPIPGATITVHYQEPSNSPGLRHGTSSETGATGLAVVGPLTPGDLEVSVEAEGFVAIEEVLAASAEGVVERTYRLTAGFAIEGRLLSLEGEPVSNLFVAARKGEITSEGGMARDDGHFRLTGLEAGTWHVFVNAGDGTICAEADVEAGCDDLELRVNIKISKALVIHVLDPAGNPIPRFEGWSGREMSSTWGEFENGRFERAAGTGALWVEVRKPRTADGEPLPYAAALIGPLTGDEEEITVRLEPGLEIQGVVLGPDGEGVEGLEIQASPLYRPDTGDVHVDGGHAETRSDEAGRFQLIGLHPGRHRVYVSVPSRYAPVERRLVDAGTDDVLFELVEAVERTARVTDSQGKPVAGARVQVTRQSGGGLCWEQTDAKGEVLLVGLAGDGLYALEVRAPRDRPELGQVDIDAWRPTAEPIVLPAADVVRGRVVDEAGAPVKDAQVTGIVEAKNHYPGDTTKADGTFVLGHLPAGPLHVFALKWGERTRRSKVVEVKPGDGDVELALGWERKLVLRVADAPASLVGKILVLSHSLRSGLDGHGHVAPDGTATLWVDPDGRYDLHFWLEEEDRLLSRRGIPGDAERVDLALAPALTISGRVHAPADVERIRVSVADPGIERRARADSEGRFTLRGLPPGTWRLKASGDGQSGAYEALLDATAGQTVELHLRPKGAAPPSGSPPVPPPPAPVPIPVPMR